VRQDFRSDFSDLNFESFHDINTEQAVDIFFEEARSYSREVQNDAAIKFIGTF